MKSNWRVLSYAALLAILIAGLVLLVTRARPIDLARYNGIVNTLRDLKQLNADWDADLLRTRIGDEADYDRVASPLPAIAGLQDELAQASQAYWESVSAAHTQQQFKPLQEKLAEVFQTKIDAVERYKSDNAVLRNSARFLPAAAMQLNQAVASGSMSASGQARLAQEINTLLASAMNFVQAPSSDLRARLIRSIDRIDALTRGESEGVAQAGVTLLAHANTVLARQASVNQLLARIAALPVARAIDDLADAQASANQRVVAETQQYQSWLEIYAVLLVAVLLLLAWRLLVGFRALGRSHAQLARANREIRASQAHLVQSEKMASLGQMVAGIAHEINTPLAYVKGTFSVLEEQLGMFGQLADASRELTQAMRAPQRDSQALNSQFRLLESSAQMVAARNVLGETDRLLTDGLRSVEQIADIVASLRNFSRLDREKVVDFSVEQGLDSTLALANNLLKNTVEVRKDYGHVPNIPGSPGQINQVFLNLITNAAHAMPAPGERTQPNIITLRTCMADDKTVRIDIQDNGKGIPKKVLPRIFDPFFTTKAVGQGTGLGLSISYKIVEEHGGRILVDTHEGQGSVFTILLPTELDMRVEVTPDLLIRRPAAAAAGQTPKPAAPPAPPKPAAFGASSPTVFSD